MNKYTEGICEDDVVILKNGERMAISEILLKLNSIDKQKQNTAANVFSYIIDHGEIIPEEVCQVMLVDFLKSDLYNK